MKPLQDPPVDQALVSSGSSHPYNKETGVFSQKSKKLNPQQQMMSDPNMMTDMLKKNLNMIVPQMLTAVRRRKLTSA